MQDNEQFNLITLLPVLKANKRTIFGVTLLALVTGLLFSFFRSKEYEAKTEFFVRNPFYNDRNVLFNRYFQAETYFAEDAVLNRILSLAKADTIQHQIVQKYHLATAYDMDTLTLKQKEKLSKKVNSNINIWKTDNKSIELSFIDKNPERAADIANLIVALLEQNLRSFYEDTRSSSYKILQEKIREEDSTIVALTDTLARLRDAYGIYDIVSPSRQNLILSNNHSNEKKGFSKGLEEIQNIESVKDQMVTERSIHISIANEYNSGNRKERLSLLQVIKKATPSFTPVGLGSMLIVLSCTLCGFLFSILLVVVPNFSK